jgi:ribosomal subunit interface protein
VRVTIRQKNLKITPALTIYIDQKVLKPIRRLLKESSAGELPILDLEFARTTRHHHKGKVYRAEANLTLGKKVFRAEAEEEDIRKACDLLQEELEQEIRSYKGKRMAQDRREGRGVKRELHYDPAARFNRKGRIRQEGI